jgi:hypothetical protein
VPIRDDEKERLAARRLPIVAHDDRWVVAFPCPAHNGRCSIYDDRPAACRTYRCDVLIAVESGEMKETEAAILLARANTLATEIRAEVPGGGDLWSDVGKFWQDLETWRRDHAALLFRMFELRNLLARIDRANGGAV